MITLTSDTGSYMDRIKTLDKKIYRELLHHPDVLRDTVHVALCENEFAGVCFLMAGSSFLSIDRKPEICHLEGNFAAVSGDAEVETSEVLIDAMVADYETIASRYPGQNIVLRTWCNAADYAYLDFLCYKGFQTGPIMLAMEKELEDSYDGLSGERKESELKLPQGMKICQLELDSKAEEEEYLSANEEGFGIPDSIGELHFRMEEQDAKVYAVCQDNKVIASVTVWPNNSDCISTENIFCRKAYRRQGITKQLLTKVLEDLAAEHYDTAELTVYGDNTGAMKLYFSLGYEIADAHLEMHYKE